MQEAYIRYDQVVMWKKPGGIRHSAILHKGDKVQVLQGWSYDDREWKDKRYVKVSNGIAVGYVLASVLTSTDKKPPDVTSYKLEDYDDGESDN